MQYVSARDIPVAFYCYASLLPLAFHVPSHPRSLEEVSRRERFAVVLEASLIFIRRKAEVSKKVPV